MQASQFSDEDLVAFIDNEAGEQKAQAIREALDDNIELRSRLEALSVDLTGLPAAHAQFQPTERLIDVLTTAETRAGTSRHLLQAACLALAVAAGALGGIAWSAKTPGWTDYVAAYHALYSPNTLADIALSTDQRMTQFTQVGAAIGKNWSLDDLPDMLGIEYRRAQLLSFEGRPLAQLSFTTSTGAPLALCIIATPDIASTAPRLSEAEGMPAAHWSAAGYEYFLIGGNDDELISRIASVYAGLLL